jgi:hypothetical protein
LLYSDKKMLLLNKLSNQLNHLIKIIGETL